MYEESNLSVHDMFHVLVPSLHQVILVGSFLSSIHLDDEQDEASRWKLYRILEWTLFAAEKLLDPFFLRIVRPVSSSQPSILDENGHISESSRLESIYEVLEIDAEACSDDVSFARRLCSRTRLRSLPDLFESIHAPSFLSSCIPLSEIGLADVTSAIPVRGVSSSLSNDHSKNRFHHPVLSLSLLSRNCDTIHLEDASYNPTKWFSLLETLDSFADRVCLFLGNRSSKSSVQSFPLVFSTLKYLLRSGKFERANDLFQLVRSRTDLNPERRFCSFCFFACFFFSSRKKNFILNTVSKKSMIFYACEYYTRRIGVDVEQSVMRTIWDSLTDFFSSDTRRFRCGCYSYDVYFWFCG